MASRTAAEGAVDGGAGGVEVGAVLERDLDQGLVLDHGDVPRQDELAQGLGRAGRLGDPHLVPQVGQGVGVVLHRHLDLLAGGLVLDVGQRRRRRRRPGWPRAAAQGLEQAVVEVGEVAGQPELLAAIGGGLEEAVGLDDGGQLGLEDVPVLLVQAALAIA